MQMSQLKSASQLAQRYGCKAVAYGPPGSGKTPAIKTAPRPVMLAVEPGLLSMRDAHNVPCWEGYTYDKIEEFFKWLYQSSEAKNFDTVAIDSGSQMAEIYLTRQLAKQKDGRKAYGEMSIEMMAHFNALYYMPQKHIYMICKQGIIEENEKQKRRPFFPGQDLNVKVPHLFDAVLHIDKAMPPGCAMPVACIRTASTFDILARDRSGNLAEYEPLDLGALFAKAMQ